MHLVDLPDTSGIHDRSVRCCVRSIGPERPVDVQSARFFEPTALFHGGFYLKPHGQLKPQLLHIFIDIATL